MNSTNTFELPSQAADRQRDWTRPCNAGDCQVVDENIKLEPVENQTLDFQDAGLCSVIELLLKNRPRLHRLIREQRFQSLLVGRLLAISLTAFIVFGLVMSLVLTVSGQWPRLTSVSDWLQAPSQPLAQLVANEPGASAATPWTSGNAFKLTAAYAVGLVAASCVCLPSLYFYC